MSQHCSDVTIDVVTDVVADVATLQLWCRGSIFMSRHRSFSVLLTSIDVGAFDPDVTTL